MRQIYLFFGPPGSGKGTQSDRLGERLGLPVISTGELLRHEQAIGSSLGKRVAKLIDAGQLVPDELIHEIIVKRLAEPDATTGFILDGYPRDAEQLRDFLAMLGGDDRLTLIEVKVSDKEVLNRLGGRRVCDCGATYHLVYNPPKQPGICDVCGRKLYLRHDDRPEIIKSRLADYAKAAEPLLSYAREHHNLVSIDGELPIEQVWQAILAALKLV